MEPLPSPLVDSTPDTGLDNPRTPGRRKGKDGFLYRLAADALRGRIRRGDYTLGERLPGNEELAQQLNVNRLTLRRALSSLIEEGWLVAQPSRGTFVARTTPSAHSRENNPDAEPRATAARGGRLATAGAPPAPVPFIGRHGAGSAKAEDPPLRVVSVVSDVYFPAKPGAYHMEFLHAVRSELAKAGCSLVIPTTGGTDIPAHASPPSDATLVLGPCMAAALGPLLDALRPVVALDAEVGDAPVDSVVVDNLAVGRLAATHLRERGHVRAAVVTGHPDQPAVRDRLAGFLAAWTAEGPDALSVPVVEGEFQKETTHDRVARLLADDPSVTALFCMNDDMAAGALAAINEAGRADVAVVGCDDVSFAAMLHPSLTTVRIPRGSMARLAVRSLLGWRAARRDKMPPVRHAVSPRLVVRASTPPYLATP